MANSAEIEDVFIKQCRSLKGDTFKNNEKHVQKTFASDFEEMSSEYWI